MKKVNSLFKGNNGKYGNAPRFIISSDLPQRTFVRGLS